MREAQQAGARPNEPKHSVAYGGAPRTRRVAARDLRRAAWCSAMARVRCAGMVLPLQKTQPRCRRTCHPMPSGMAYIRHNRRRRNRSSQSTFRGRVPPSTLGMRKMASPRRSSWRSLRRQCEAGASRSAGRAQPPIFASTSAESARPLRWRSSRCGPPSCHRRCAQLQPRADCSPWQVVVCDD